jgi:hypothetical protein
MRELAPPDAGQEMTVMTLKLTLALAATLALGPSVSAQEAAAPAGAPSQQDQVAALKKALADGQAKIRQYEWVETTIISMKGEEKARTQKRCYYGADGKVQKVAMADAAAPPPDDGGKSGGRGGRRGGGKAKEKIVENKKEEISTYMKNAAALIHQYVPPDPAKIQAAKAAGHVKVEPQGGGPVRIVVADYQLPGDSLNIDLDPKAGRLVGLSVNTYLEKKDDAVTLVVQMANLPDGASYPAQTTLDAKAKNMTVVIQNGGHRPVAK